MSDRDLTTSRNRVFGHVEKGTTCRVCGRDVEDGRRKTCGDYCQTILEEVMSLLNWGGVRRRIVERDDETCQRCGFKQEWIDLGHEHLKAIVEEKCPERPESPDDWSELSDDEARRHRERFRGWREACWQVSREYIGVRWHPGGLARFPYSELEVDHITPVSEGGHPFDPANLRTLCVDCHKRKTAREASERAEQPEMERPEIELVEFGIGSDGP